MSTANMHVGKRIVLTTFGSFGDIHPYMAIALELQKRGHSPIIATSGLYREKIEAAGLEFVSVQPNLPPPQEQDQEIMDKVMEPKSGPRFLMEELIFPFVRQSYEDVLKTIDGADLLVTHPATVAGPLVARKSGIPWISTVLAPMSFFSAYDPPVPPFWQWLVKFKVLGPAFVKTGLDLAKKQVRAKPVDDLRKGLGVPYYGNPVFEGQHSPALVLALFSSVFAAPQPDWPQQTRITGFAFYDSGSEPGMTAELSRFLDEGPPPVVFTLGTSAVWVARDFFHESIAAAGKLGRRAVLLIGDDRNLPRESLPAGIIAVNYAPFESLLPRACAMVHHGGVGTTSQGLRAGVPTLIVPFAFDQSDNAAHAQRLGSSRTLYRKNYLAPRVVKELGTLLDRPRYAIKAKRVGELLQREDGATVACNFVEEFLDRPRNVDNETDRESELTYAPGD